MTGKFKPCFCIFRCVFIDSWGYNEIEVTKKFHSYEDAEDWGVELSEKYADKHGEMHFSIYDL